MKDLLEAFLDMMGAERGASINTISAYRRDLLDFAGHCAAKGASARDARRDDIKAYLARLSNSGIAGSTQARRLSALRQFFAFLYSEGFRKDDPTDAIDAPRRERPLPKVLSRDDLDALIAAARTQSEKSPEGLRLLCVGRDALRLGPARLRARDAAARHRAQPRRLPPGEGQGRQGAPRAAERPRPRRDPLLPDGAGAIPPRRRPPRPCRALPLPLALRGRGI
ncbi:MAG: site-specific integrase [Rhizomicrobium sp.]